MSNFERLIGEALNEEEGEVPHSYSKRQATNMGGPSSSARSSQRLYKSATTAALIESDPFRKHKDLLKYSTLRQMAELNLEGIIRPNQSRRRQE